MVVLVVRNLLQQPANILPDGIGPETSGEQESIEADELEDQDLSEGVSPDISALIQDTTIPVRAINDQTEIGRSFNGETALKHIEVLANEIFQGFGVGGQGAYVHGGGTVSLASGCTFSD